MIERRKTRIVKIGNRAIGGKNKIAVQSMLNVPANDVEGNVKQALELEKAGCEIVRLTVPDTAAVKTLYAVKEAVKIPVVADIHFDYRCALESVAAGACGNSPRWWKRCWPISLPAAGPRASRASRWR